MNLYDEFFSGIFFHNPPCMMFSLDYFQVCNPPNNQIKRNQMYSVYLVGKQGLESMRCRPEVAEKLFWCKEPVRIVVTNIVNWIRYMFDGIFVCQTRNLINHKLKLCTYLAFRKINKPWWSHSTMLTLHHSIQGGPSLGLRWPKTRVKIIIIQKLLLIFEVFWASARGNISKRHLRFTFETSYYFCPAKMKELVALILKGKRNLLRRKRESSELYSDK